MSFRGTIGDVVERALENSCADLEKYIRTYLRTHRTTRMDIVLIDYGTTYQTPDSGGFFLRQDTSGYVVRVIRNVQIIQKLPESFRPNLPD